MTSPIDKAVREAVLDTQQSFAVSAPAGSGKTGLLSLRVLSLLATCKQPEEILCITFTRKAAEEMSERILGALKEAQTLSQNDIGLIEDPHHANLMRYAKAAADNNDRLNWHLEEMPFRLKILTIDGFCRSLTQQMPLMSRAGTAPAMVEDTNTVFEEAVISLLDSCNSNGWPNSLKVLFQHLGGDLDRLARLLMAMLQTRDQWLPLIYSIKSVDDSKLEVVQEWLESNLSLWAEELLHELADDLQLYEGELCELLDFAGTHLQNDKPDSISTALSGVHGFPVDTTPQIAIKEFWQPFANIALTATEQFIKRVDKRHGFPTGDKETKAEYSDKKTRYLALLKLFAEKPTVRENLASIQQFVSLTYSPQQWRVLSALIELLPLLTAHLKLVFQKNGNADFVEIAECAREALGGFNDITELALKLDYQLNHILIDEFQDTSHSQLQLLQLLTREWDSTAGKTLFIVGDGMQSCYGFRNANVGIFLDVRKHGLEGKELNAVDLSVNFRSTSTIIDWVNHSFDSAFPKKDNISLGAVRYTPSHAFTQIPETDSSSYVQCRGFIDQPNREQEAIAIAEEIVELKSSYPEDSIAILVRGRGHLSEILPALHDRDIAYSAVDIDPLLSRPCIQNILALTLVLENPADNASWLTLLRSPWCGVDNVDLYSLFNPLESTIEYSLLNKMKLADSSGQLKAEGKAVFRRLQTSINSALTLRERRPMAELVESAWIELGGPETLKNKSEIKDIGTFLRLLSKYAPLGRMTEKQSFMNALEKLFAQPESSAGAVQILTMHKSKGLEFDSVFLPSLDKQGKADTADLLNWHERLNTKGELDLLISPISASDAADRDPLTLLISREAKRRKELEETRLLYVACTRAKKRLYLSCNVKPAKDDALKPPSSSSMVSKLWPVIQRQIQLFESTVENESTELDVQQVERTYIRRLPLNYSGDKPQSTDIDKWKPAIFDNTEIQVIEDFKGASNAPLAIAVGIVLHRILQNIHREGYAQWQSRSPDTLSPFWQAQLEQNGLGQSAAQQGVAILSSTLPLLLSDSKAAWLLDNRHTDSQCEYRLCYGKPARYAILDRTFVDAKGIRWIVDYKSSIPAEGENIETFILREKASYQPQLTHYQKLMQGLDQTTPALTVHGYRTALYFPRIGELAEYT